MTMLNHTTTVLGMAIAAMSIVLVLLLGTIGNSFGNSNIQQEAFAQMQPDNTYIPSNGVLNVPPEMVAIP